VEGPTLGLFEGDWLGVVVGSFDGDVEGPTLGLFEGDWLGVVVGSLLGLREGERLGIGVVGLCVGETEGG